MENRLGWGGQLGSYHNNSGIQLYIGVFRNGAIPVEKMKRLYSEYISEVEWVGFSDGQYVGCKKKREANIDSEVFALGSCKNRIATC